MLDYYRDTQRVNDCHFLARVLGTGKFEDFGIPTPEELRKSGLEQAGSIKFEDIYSEQRHIDRSLMQLGG